MNKYILIVSILIFMSDPNQIIFDFTKDSDISLWRVVDDVVMGGVSEGIFRLNQDGNGLYSGKVSLDNNGGFSSLRYQFNEKDISKYSKIILKVKGDGKNYQFRVKNNFRNFYSYIKTFATSKDWQLIEIQLSEMYPAFRGRKLSLPNFSSDEIEEIAFLIGNKKDESFRLEIDKIYLE
jgi:NADH dehydrogenase [ubiquinone] 1 alpha subcomplex assembly factor 1